MKRRLPLFCCLALAPLILVRLTSRRDPLPDLPTVMLWAWESPQDLRFLKPGSAGIAYLDRTVWLDARRVRSRPRLQPLRFTPGTDLVAVVRLENVGNELPEAASVVRQVIPALDGSGVRSLEIDYDARQSQRAWYAEFLRELRRSMPTNVALTITALESWCEEDHWIRDLPVATTPMLFRMGPDDRRTPTEFPAGVCRSSVGVSTDELPVHVPRAQRFYIFPSRSVDQGCIRRRGCPGREVETMKALQVTFAMAAILFFATPEGLDSCGMGGPVTVFVTREGPADVLQFLKGKAGILRRSYAPQHMFGAFRALSGVPLTEGEYAALYARPAGVNTYSYPPDSDKWMAERKSVPGLAVVPPVDAYKKIAVAGFLMYFENCKADAFATATATLDEVKQEWGAADSRTVEWAAAQDDVFSNCAGVAATIPAPPAPDMDPLLAAHRRYQIAAALFYADQFRKASDAFDAIAKDGESPWRGYAPYLAGRALLRAGMLDLDDAAFREGKDRMMAIVNDPELEEWHEPSHNMIELWRIRVEPLKRVAELSRELMQPRDEDTSQSAIDLFYLVTHRVYGGSRPWPADELTEVEKTAELAAWLMAMSQDPPADAGERSVEWWRKGHNPAWLIASLANAQEKNLPELLEAARQVPPGSPAFESIAFYAASIQSARGQRESARNWADRALRQKLGASSRNSMMGLRMRLARSWEEFLQYSLRSPEPGVVEFWDKEEPGQNPNGTAAVFDWDAVDVFNLQVPLSLWVNASESKLLPRNMQLLIAETGWMRAMVAGKNAEARNFMQRVLALDPKSAEPANGFLSAHDAEEAQFAAVYAILKIHRFYPSLQPPGVVPRNYGYYEAGSHLRTPTVGELRFLTAEQRAAAKAEWTQVEAGGMWSFTRLATDVLSWARKHPDDKHVPEALHLIVRASFTGHDEKNSKEAFGLLHRNYPKSEWTTRTKYGYK